MLFRRISGPIRLDFTNGGGVRSYALDPRSGGHRCKIVQFMVKVVASGGTTPKLGCIINHGPDGILFAAHTATGSAVVPASNLYVFDGGAAPIGEYIQVVLNMDGGAAADAWMVVEVFEMRKPF